MAVTRDYNRFLKSKKEIGGICDFCRQLRKSYKFFNKHKDCDFGGVARLAYKMLKNNQKLLLDYRARRKNFLF